MRWLFRNAKLDPISKKNNGHFNIIFFRANPNSNSNLKFGLTPSPRLSRWCHSFSGCTCHTQKYKKEHKQFSETINTCASWVPRSAVSTAERNRTNDTFNSKEYIMVLFYQQHDLLVVPLILSFYNSLLCLSCRAINLELPRVLPFCSWQFSTMLGRPLRP